MFVLGYMFAQSNGVRAPQHEHAWRAVLAQCRNDARCVRLPAQLAVRRRGAGGDAQYRVEQQNAALRPIGEIVGPHCWRSQIVGEFFEYIFQ